MAENGELVQLINRVPTTQTLTIPVHSNNLRGGESINQVTSEASFNHHNSLAVRCSSSQAESEMKVEVS